MGNVKYYDNNKLKLDTKYLNGRKEIEQKRQNIWLWGWIINNSFNINNNIIIKNNHLKNW